VSQSEVSVSAYHRVDEAPYRCRLIKQRGSGFNADPFLRRAAKTSFYNTSPMDLKAIAGDPDNVAGSPCSKPKIMSSFT